MKDTAHHHSLKGTLELLWSEIDGYALRRLGLSLLLVMLSAALSALAPLVYKLIIDRFSAENLSAALSSPMLLIASYVLAQYLMRCTSEWRSLAHGQGVQRLNRCLSQRLFEHILNLPMRFHLERRTGAIGETLGQGLNGCQMLLQHLVFTFLPILVEFTMIAGVLIHFGHAAYLAIFGLAGVAYTAAFWRGATNISAPSREVSTAHIDAHAMLTDSLINYETVKYFHGEPQIAARYEKALSGTEFAWRRFLNFRIKNGLLVATIFALSLGSSLALAGHDVMQSNMSLGDFVLINSYIIRLMQPLEVIGFAIRDLAQGLSYTEKMLEIFNEPKESEATTETCRPASVHGKLTFDHVDFSYGADRAILRDISFSTPAGGCTAIVGVSGSGKSSMIRLLFRLYEPESGAILFDDTPIALMSLSDLRRMIAIVPQDTILFNDTIAANIAFGKQEATQEDIERVAKLAHLHDFIDKLPEGYETKVGERGLKLSGGEKQRIAIARAALKQPSIFVFDEATSSLDSNTERDIMRNLIDVSRTSTTLIIAHRLSTVVHADEILVLHEGSIVERGTHSQLLSLNGRYAALWQAQQSSRQRTTPAVDQSRALVGRLLEAD